MKFHRIILIITVFACSYFFQTLLAMNDDNEAFEVFLILDKLAFEENEKILLHINVKNNRDNFRSFKIYDHVYTTFRPIVYDTKGREIDGSLDHD